MVKWRWIVLAFVLSGVLVYFGLLAPKPTPGPAGWPLLPAAVLLLAGGVGFAVKTKDSAE